MMRWLAVVLLLLGTTNGEAAGKQPPVGVTVEHHRDGSWTADYRFSEDAGAWMFPRSAPDLDGAPWRQQGWRVETPGVRLERHGRYDALVGARTVPRRVRVRFVPYGLSLRADYTPALRFSDGGIAFFTDHFLVAPQPSAAAVAKLGFELDNLDERPTTVTFRDPGRSVLLRGVVSKSVAKVVPDRTNAYVYIGSTSLVTTPAFAGVIDPGLPVWVRTELDTFLPRLLAYYTARFGAPKTGRPTALVSWGGGAGEGASFGGSVLDGMVVMDLAGKQVRAPTDRVRDRLRWFFGHETAHFWMGHTVEYANKRDAWIMEGSADLLAIRAIGALAPGYDMRREIQREVDDCIAINGTQPLGGASERGEVRANYACGALLLLAAESAEQKRDPDADAATFARRLIDDNRVDGKVSAADWTARFAEVARNPAVAARIDTFLERGVADPVTFLADLFSATGVQFERVGDTLKLL